MKATVNNLNPYQIVWIEFRAKKGIVTKKDQKILNPYNRATIRKNVNGQYFLHFGCLSAAESHLKEINFARLTKQYEVRYCYDVQFSRGIVDTVTHINTVKYTHKQEEEMQVVGPCK